MYIYNQQFFKKYSSSYKNILQIIISIKIMLIEHFFLQNFLLYKSSPRITHTKKTSQLLICCKNSFWSLSLEIFF